MYRLIKAKPLVAIVQDDPASQKTLARVLRRGGYEAVNPDVPKPEVRRFRQKASHELLNRDGPVSARVHGWQFCGRTALRASPVFRYQTSMALFADDGFITAVKTSPSRYAGESLLGAIVPAMV